MVRCAVSMFPFLIFVPAWMWNLQSEDEVPMPRTAYPEWDDSMNRMPKRDQTINGRYLILENLGRGGSAFVYTAEHLLEKKKYAIKVRQVMYDSYILCTSVCHAFYMVVSCDRMCTGMMIIYVLT
jgi:hypothetical protein